MEAFKKFIRIRCKIEVSFRDKRVVNTLEKAAPALVGALAKIITRRIGKQVIGRAEGLRRQKRLHHGKIPPDKLDIFQVGFGGFMNGAKKRLLRKVDAEHIDIGILPRTRAHKRPRAAAKVDFKG